VREVVSVSNIIQRVRNAPGRHGTVSPKKLRNEAQTSPATTTDRERIARLKVTRPLVVRGDKRFQVAVPAYESFSTNGTAGDTETFDLGHSLIEQPNTQNLVVWNGSSYVGGEGALDAVDYGAGTFDYSDPGTNNTLHVWYMSGAHSELEIEKITSNENNQQGLFTGSLSLIHQRNQSEQPVSPDVGKTDLNPAVDTDMYVDVYLKSRYTFKWSAAGGDATPTNLLFSFPVERKQREIPGLDDAVALDMSQA
jgi:hypothetical protein